MAAFEFKALNAKGRTQKGVIEGDNARQVRLRLKEQGLVPVEVTETRQKSNSQSSNTNKGFKPWDQYARFGVDYSSISHTGAVGDAVGRVLKSRV